MLASVAAGADEPTWVTLAPYVVAGMSVLGTAAVAVLASRQTHAAWLREQRLMAYSTFLGQASGLISANDDLVRLGGRAARAEAASQVKAARVTLDQALSTIKVLGPEPVATAANAYFSALMGLVAVTWGHPAGDEAAARADGAMGGVHDAHRAFVAVARIPVAGRRRSA